MQSYTTLQIYLTIIIAYVYEYDQNLRATLAYNCKKPTQGAFKISS